MSNQEFIDPAGDKAANPADNQLHGVELTSLRPLPTDVPGKTSEITHLGSTGIETVSYDYGSPYAKAGAMHASKTAQEMISLLSQTNDPDRGDKALAVLDTAVGKETRLYYDKSFPATGKTRYEAFEGALLYGWLPTPPLVKDAALTQATKLDHDSHPFSDIPYDKWFGSVSKLIADDVNSGNLPKAVQDYDQAFGAFIRRYTDSQDGVDTRMIPEFETKIQAQLKELKVWEPLRKEMVAELNQ